MKNYWAQRRMINLGSFQCYDRGRVLLLSKQSSISSITLSAYMGRFVCKPYVRTSLRVRLLQSSVVTQVLDSSPAIHSSTPWQSKKVTIQPPNGKWSFNSFYTSKNSE